MNLLAGCERSIVTPIAGTTRDVIEETVTLDGLVLRLCDTAGLRSTDDAVEQIGVRMTLERIDSADLVIAVLDGTADFTEDVFELLNGLINRPAVAVFNKSDIADFDRSKLQEIKVPCISMSAKNGIGYDQFVAAVKGVTGTNKLNGGSAVYLNERQRDCVIRALSFVREALETLQSGMTVDAVGVCLDDALAALMELSGERVTVEVADKVFENFCVGK